MGTCASLISPSHVLFRFKALLSSKPTNDSTCIEIGYVKYPIFQVSTCRGRNSQAEEHSAQEATSMLELVSSHLNKSLALVSILLLEQSTRGRGGSHGELGRACPGFRGQFVQFFPVEACVPVF